MSRCDGSAPCEDPVIGKASQPSCCASGKAIRTVLLPGELLSVLVSERRV